MTAKTLAGYAALRNFDFNGKPIAGGTVVPVAEMSADDAAPFLAVGVVVEVELGVDPAKAEPAGEPEKKTTSYGRAASPA